MLLSLLLLVASASAAKRSALYHIYSLPTPYIFSDPLQYQAPSSPSIFSGFQFYNFPQITPVPPLTAVVDLKNYGGNEVTGRVMMTQVPGGPVIIMGNVTGLTEGAHGLHIHEFGDLSQGCESLGGHFNPSLTHHGGPADPYRHVGDLGNIMADGEGKTKISDSDHLISLTGPHGVLGRGLAISANKDDYGRGGDKESLRSGNSGAAVACGVISWARPPLARPQPPPQGGQQPEPEAEQIEP